MQYEFFTVPAEGGANEAEVLNRFLRSARVVNVVGCALHTIQRR